MPDFLRFNLAHEVVHLLSPPDASDVNYLEEGTAVSFSATRNIYRDPRYLKAQLDLLERYPTDKYTEAWKDVQLLERLDPRAIGNLRTKSKSLSQITVPNILDVVPMCDGVLADRLCRKFDT